MYTGQQGKAPTEQLNTGQHQKEEGGGRSRNIQYSTKVFGALESISRFLAISPKQMQISTPNFQHPLSHQYHMLWESLKVQGIIGRPQMTSE